MTSLKPDYTHHASLMMLRDLAATYALTQDQLNRICHVVTGYAIDHVVPSEAEMIASMLESKGPIRSKEWAMELMPR